MIVFRPPNIEEKITVLRKAYIYGKALLRKAYIYGKALFSAGVVLGISAYQILADHNVSLTEARAFWTVLVATVAGVGTAVVGPKVQRPAA